MAHEDEELTELSDLDVLNVDLVGKAAIQRRFLIIKRQEGGMKKQDEPEAEAEIEIEEVEKDVAAGLALIEEWAATLEGEAAADVMAALAEALAPAEEIKAADLDDEEVEIEMAKADLAVGKARIEKTRLALRHAEINLDFTTIRSPVTGVVGMVPLPQAIRPAPATG